MAAPARPRKRPAKKKTGPTPAAPPPGATITDADIAAMEAAYEADIEAADDGQPIGPGGEIRPVEIGKAGRPGPEMQHVFTLDGERYEVPKHPSPAVTLKFLREARDKKVGADLAVENAMLDLLGKRALDALAESPETTDEDCAKVFAIIAHLLWGGVKRLRAAAAPPRAG